MKQKDIWLESEGNAWFSRNHETVATCELPDSDPLLLEILGIYKQRSVGEERLKVLEVGCGDGTRLAWLKNNLNADCYGIEPSAQAVAAACAKGVKAQQGTADILPFDNSSFDVVIFGFCLYLCDREDLFSIASAADRVLRSPGWLMILDFFSSTSYTKDYHHFPGVMTNKMNYSSLFSWHPNYQILKHTVSSHMGLSEGKLIFTDDQNEWIAVSILRKLKKG